MLKKRYFKLPQIIIRITITYTYRHVTCISKELYIIQKTLYNISSMLMSKYHSISKRREIGEKGQNYDPLICYNKNNNLMNIYCLLLYNMLTYCIYYIYCIYIKMFKLY